MDTTFYFNYLYPFQDRLLDRVNKLETEFYLTGGTAASRGYLQHRFSDDLDLFVNDDPRFSLWADRILQSLSRPGDWRCDVMQRDERFLRLVVSEEDLSLKIELVNDVPSHVGSVEEHSTLGRLDSPENILANKISALIDRHEPKDLADIWGFCCRLKLNIEEAIQNSQSKASGVFPADLARLLCQVSRVDWELVRWIDAPPFERFQSDLTQLGENLLLLK